MRDKLDVMTAEVQELEQQVRALRNDSQIDESAIPVEVHE